MTIALEQKLVIRLLGGARGDLALDGNGDLRYGIKTHDDGSQTREANGPKLARLTLADDGREYLWRITPAGATFLLENLYDDNKRVTRFLQSIAA